MSAPTPKRQRGAVTHPDTDRRLSANKGGFHPLARTFDDRKPGCPGRVKNPETDRRLKKNRGN